MRLEGVAQGEGEERPLVGGGARGVNARPAHPLLLWHVLQARAVNELDAGRRDVADALADEALPCAQVARDDWAVAMAAFFASLVQLSLVLAAAALDGLMR